MAPYLGVIFVSFIIFLTILVKRYYTNSNYDPTRKQEYVLILCYQVMSLKLAFKFDFCAGLNLPAISIN